MHLGSLYDTLFAMAFVHKETVMGQPNDAQQILKLTSDILARRTAKFGGTRVNHIHGIILKYCPVVQKLVDKGYGRLEKTYAGSKTSYLLFLHNEPTTVDPKCPCCDNIIQAIPEISMRDHKKDCRFRNYYKRNYE